MGNCCTTKVDTKVNSDNTNNGINARNTNGSQFQQNYPRTNSSNGGKKACPYCFEPVGKDFCVKFKDEGKCAKCNECFYLYGENTFHCDKCHAYFHLKCVD